MHPVLFKLGHFELHSWGLAFASAVLMGIWVAIRRASRFKVSTAAVQDVSLLIVVSAILGSRFWYVVYHLAQFRGRWLDTVNPFQGETIGIRGMSMTGGVVLAIVATFLYTRLRHIRFVTLGDVMAPSFLLGAGIQRVGGCFMAGCCFGLPTDSVLGVVFPASTEAHRLFHGAPVWPAQLFASALGFFGFALILWLDRRHSFPGYSFWLVFIYYPLDRFIVDQFRFYPPDQILTMLGPLRINVNHTLLGGLFLLSLTCWLWGWKTCPQHTS